VPAGAGVGAVGIGRASVRDARILPRPAEVVEPGATAGRRTSPEVVLGRERSGTPAKWKPDDDFSPRRELSGRLARI